MGNASWVRGHVGGLPEILTGDHFTQHPAPGKHSVILFLFFLKILFIFYCHTGSLLRYTGSSSPCLLLVGAWALGAGASVVVERGFSCPAACGILPNQGANLCPLHWQVDARRLYHQGSHQSLLMTITVALLVVAPSL